MQKKLTINDIARMAQVSKATVSRVLNRHSSVDPVLRERVMDIVQQYNFVPNTIATELANGRTHLIGVLAPPLNWPAIPEILHGVSEHIEHTRYEIVLYSMNLERNHSDVLDRILAMRMVSGLLAILPGELADHLDTFFQQGLPLVMIDDQKEPTHIPWVGIDNFASAYEATSYLLQLGHRRIAHIMGPQHYYCVVQRLEGYRQALTDAGLQADPELLFQGEFEPASGRRCAETIFAQDQSAWPDAIFVGNDQMAYGVLEVAEAQKIQVPEAVSIIGFDDNLLSAHMRPPLTTIHQPFTEMGYQATQLLLSMIDPNYQPDNEQPTRIQLPTHLVTRVSSASTHPFSLKT
ncbi:LacI family transcriptional regulator [Dictyobacter alpinus]|uniref:LacI family transcriptional regulator n=1 Tax=Dictyobacter alpinus TaxID=2014873 RepID=A0A402BK68_9CHLR|nr:LacI family DNA-binding transcriptional regulator [Dictyobacter alpinus]GCE31743.1 LacI family transcriptional regulator [Dictyobacter alpinus]